ncbi:hypothetical protein D021_1564B, partial [Vibrio parahaemolyticus 10296]
EDLVQLHVLKLFWR